MDVRIVLLATNILLASIILGFVGYFIGIYSIIGVAASIGTVGATLLVIGLSYREPSYDLMLRYCEVARSVLAKLVEDMGLASHTLYAIPGKDAVTIVISKPNTRLRNPRPLVGVGESPYVAFKINFEREPVIEAGENALDVFMTRMIDTYGVSRHVEAVFSNGEGRIVFQDINEAVKPLLKKPLSPVTIIALAELARLLNKKLMLVEERVLDNSLEMRVVTR